MRGVRVFGTAGLLIADRTARTHEQALQMPLVPGRNKVQVSALNRRGTESLKQTVYTTSGAKPPPRDIYVVAKGGLVPLALKYNGTGNVASVQVPGSLSYPLGARVGSFEHSIPNADIRAIFKRDEAAILSRCQSTLEFNNVTTIDTVHDSRIPVTVNAADGTVVASTTVPYQLGLTCRR